MTRPARCVRLRFADGSELVGTGLHPVWNVDRNDWLPMQEFAPGDSVLADGEPLTVLAVDPLAATEPAPRTSKIASRAGVA